MRGEYPNHGTRLAKAMELPPHARRIPLRAMQVCSLGGTTSACAENTRTQLGVPSAERNYLRMRGEYNAMNGFMAMTAELPPHARRIPNQRHQRR